MIIRLFYNRWMFLYQYFYHLYIIFFAGPYKSCASRRIFLFNDRLILIYQKLYYFQPIIFAGKYKSCASLYCIFYSICMRKLIIILLLRTYLEVLHHHSQHFYSFIFTCIYKCISISIIFIHFFWIHVFCNYTIIYCCYIAIFTISKIFVSSISILRF